MYFLLGTSFAGHDVTVFRQCFDENIDENYICTLTRKLATVVDRVRCTKKQFVSVSSIGIVVTHSKIFYVQILKMSGNESK